MDESSEAEPKIDAVISGEVAEVSGSTIEDAQVTVFRLTGKETQLASGTTGNDGAYELDLSVAEPETLDSVQVRAEAEGFAISLETEAFSENIEVDLTLPNFEGGVGTQSNPYQIATVEQLQEIGEFPASHYVQVQDIDASSTELDSETEFEPIGKEENPFSGTFDGKNYEISNLKIGGYYSQSVGVFEVVSGGKISNVILNQAVVEDGATGGMLVGTNRGGIIKKSSVEGEIYEIPNAGGLVGLNNEGIIVDSESSGSINSESFDNSGSAGLVSINTGEIRSCESSTNIIGGGLYSAGFVSENRGVIKRSVSTGDVSSRGRNNSLGGFVGINATESVIEDSRATGDIQVFGDNGDAGGFAVENTGTIRNSVATGDVTLTGESSGRAGGLAAYNLGRIIRSRASGNVVVVDNDAGGLVGKNVGEIRESKATGAVEAIVGVISNAGRVGGLVGTMQEGGGSVSAPASISASYSTGSVATNDPAHHDAGGLIGVADGGVITESFAVGLVSSDADAYTSGGLIGRVRSIGPSPDTVSLSSTVWDTVTTGQGEAIGNSSMDGTASLNTSEMQGNSAEENMDGFDFQDTWRVVMGDYPALQWEE
jgi:hypothetical protein